MAGTRITQLVRGIPGRRYGAFSGKTTAPTHPVGEITRLTSMGVPGRRTGSFAGKTAGGGFPTQYQGLRVYDGGVVELCLVATADAPSGMGGQMRIRKNSTTYAVYLVETNDANASTVRIRTTTGTKSIRLKT